MNGDSNDGYGAAVLLLSWIENRREELSWDKEVEEKRNVGEEEKGGQRSPSPSTRPQHSQKSSQAAK